MQDILIFEWLSIFDSSPYDYINVHINQAHRKLLQRIKTLLMMKTVYAMEEMQKNAAIRDRGDW